MNIRIERPTLNRPTPEQNIALVDAWIADTADKLNMFIEKMNRELEGVKDACENSNLT